MLRFPSHHLTPTARENLERFRATSAAKDLEEGPLSWEVVEWSWGQGNPFRVQVRSEEGDVVELVMEQDGAWRMHPDPNVPREPHS